MPYATAVFRLMQGQGGQRNIPQGSPVSRHVLLELLLEGVSQEVRWSARAFVITIL